ncbi:MAG: tetratricopeptide repeat protein [Epsilonproteobacteria bacterium]|nr:tetratricopeptide repeat protein [Campylobacterota bacterium]
MRRVWLFGVAAALWANEPSVFEAGNLDSEQPYGLTPAERKIYENSQQIKRLRKDLFTLHQRVESLEEKIDGLKSVVEGLDENLNRFRKGPKEDYAPQIARLRADLNESIEIQKENNAKIRKILQQMSSLIDRINASYVSKKELQSELAKIYALLDKKGRTSDKLHTSKNGAQLYKEAHQAYRRKEYKKAAELFEAAAQKHYKPAASNFYIGESCYYTKDYACAVRHYKKSASLYQNASYMPTLLLHTAISLDRLGKKEEAKRFYGSVIKLYPDTKAAALAKKYMR